MVDAEFTHVGDRCTYEVLLARLPLDDSALRAIGEVVHDIDLKDDAFARPETAGIETLLRGLVASCPDDAERMERGMSLFDDLYRAYSKPGGKRAPRRP